ncbi:MAG: hypothetical protein HN909_02785 [Phycisphaerales bacterium]|jgi:hypothetical protein|nr:hypothetical protein [Phycisphaerales bacterium]MBT7170678.1 hypothetical protein [Phycisphaerales bacterium]
MLGRLRRTTRNDVALSLAFTGLVFLTWSFIAFTAKNLFNRLVIEAQVTKALDPFTLSVKRFFVDYGFVIDLTGLAWMLASLTLVLLASRQRISISWSWLSSGLQVLVASVGSIVVHTATAATVPHKNVVVDASITEKIGSISWPVVLGIAVMAWLFFLIRMTKDRGKFVRPRQTLNDSFRSNQ